MLLAHVPELIYEFFVVLGPDEENGSFEFFPLGTGDQLLDATSVV